MIEFIKELCQIAKETVQAEKDLESENLEKTQARPAKDKILLIRRPSNVRLNGITLDLSNKLHFLHKIYWSECNTNTIMRSTLEGLRIETVAGIDSTLVFPNDVIYDSLSKNTAITLCGILNTIPIKEEQNLTPINPYGKTKSVVENILSDYDKSYGLKYISLRYFNACGAHIDGTIGERHNPETHLIPLILQTASGRRNNFKIYGDDYKTKDGTCIRDYIHVMDIAEAHLLSLEKLIQTQSSDIYNIGNKQGYSVREIIDMVEEITQIKVPYKISEKRKGDPAELIADNSKITEKLNWRAKYSDLNTIINTAWEWEKKLSNF